MERSGHLLSRNFVLLWQGNAVSLAGTQFFLIGLMLWVKEATGSTSLVGTLMMVGGLAAFVSPIGGTLADRYDRARVLVVLDLVSGTVILSLVAMFLLFPERTPLLIACLFAVQIVRGICDSFFFAAVQALVPDIVSRERLPAANSWLQSTFHLTRLLGFGLGGVLFRILGAPLLFLVDGVTFLLSAVSEAFIRLPPRPERPKEPLGKALGRFAGETAEGFRYALGSPGLRVFIVTAAAYNFFQAGFFVLLPFYVSDFLHASVDWYGYIVGALALGIFLGVVGAGFARLEGARRVGVLISCLVLVGLARGGIAFVRDPVAALVLYVIAGLATGFWSVYITAILQGAVPDEVRGRVMGVIQAFRWGLVPVGMGFFGLLADLVGGRLPEIFLACAAILIAVTVWSASRPDWRELLRS
jgi:MFS family permease